MKNWLVKVTSFLLYLCLTFPCLAENKSVKVTASVPDEIAPTAPILVAPANGSFLQNPTPTFIFKKAYDAQSPVRHYVMYLNNTIFIPEIPSSQTPVENDNFYCLIDQETISLTIKKPLAEATYSWKIRAYDMYGNWVDSATWTFTIDLTSPFVILTQIGENNNLNLSSQDPNSIPPGLQITTFIQQPEFIGKSEPGTTIYLKLKLLSSPSSQTIELQTITDSQGNFLIIPETNLKIDVYQILLIAADAASNTTVLPEFLLVVKKAPTPPAQPPTIFQQPQALLQLPQAKKQSNPLELIISILTLTLLLLWLLLSKISYKTSLKLLIQFLGFNLLPPWLKKKKLCFSFNQLNKTKTAFTTITIFNQNQKIQDFLTDQKAKFNLKLNQGVFQIKAFKPGFLITQQSLKLAKTSQIALCLPLFIDIKEYKKYSLIILIAKLIIILALISSISTMIFFPSLITLIMFIICLDLNYNFLL